MYIHDTGNMTHMQSYVVSERKMVVHCTYTVYKQIYIIFTKHLSMMCLICRHKMSARHLNPFKHI